MKRVKELQERGISLKEALEDDADRLKNQKGIQKRATLVKAGDTAGELDEGSPMRPDDEQLAKINQFTRRAVTADEVVAFKTYSCNDMPDRDDDQFVAECVKGFAALEGPFSPIGKSYMVGHDYSKLAVGRIFDADVETVKGVTFLTNQVYIPNTESNKSFIEGIDFGVNWAVSVGVMLGQDSCTVCAAPFSSWGWFCQNGHDKGASYDPNSEETDSWGYPQAVDPNSKGAVKCIRQFKQAKDFYELSQVFLGAQYDAEIGKGFAKAASALKVPLLGLSTEEAKTIDVVHEPDAVMKARELYNVKTTDDGVLRWKDADSLVWTFDPNSANDGIMSLGKSSEEDESNQEEEDGRNSIGSVEEVEPVSVESEDEGIGGGTVEQGDEEVNQASPGSAEHVSGNVGGDSVEVIAEENGNEEEMDKAAVLKAATAARLPHSVIGKVADAEGNGLAVLLAASASEIEAATKRAESFEAKALLGDQYVKGLRSDAIDWYVKAHATGNGAVNVDTLNKMLDRFGDDAELIKSVIDENMALAQAKFPSAVRRSSAPVDPNVADVPTGLKSADHDDEYDRFAKKRHG